VEYFVSVLGSVDAGLWAEAAWDRGGGTVVDGLSACCRVDGRCCGWGMGRVRGRVSYLGWQEREMSAAEVPWLTRRQQQG